MNSNPKSPNPKSGRPFGLDPVLAVRLRFTRFTSLISLTSLVCLSLLCSCVRTEIRESAYADGTPKTRSVFTHGPGGILVPHGVQLSWYPGGGKKSMEMFANGYRQGYVFRWHPDGKRESIEHFTDGIRNGQARYWEGSFAGRQSARGDTPVSTGLAPTRDTR